MFLFPIVEDDEDLTKYILQAEFDGRLKSNEGFLSATGNLATLTAASGKDLYLTSAKVHFHSNSASNATAVTEVTLDINGTIVETVKSGHNGIILVHDYEFKNIGHSVAATEIIKLEVISIDAAVDVEGFVQAIEVPSGENPVTYTGA
jgi:hypothetical protein